MSSQFLTSGCSCFHTAMNSSLPRPEPALISSRLKLVDGSPAAATVDAERLCNHAAICQKISQTFRGLSGPRMIAIFLPRRRSREPCGRTDAAQRMGWAFSPQPDEPPRERASQANASAALSAGRRRASAAARARRRPPYRGSPPPRPAPLPLPPPPLLPPLRPAEPFELPAPADRTGEDSAAPSSAGRPQVPREPPLRPPLPAGRHRSQSLPPPARGTVVETAPASPAARPAAATGRLRACG